MANRGRSIAGRLDAGDLPASRLEEMLGPLEPAELAAVGAAVDPGGLVLLRQYLASFGSVVLSIGAADLLAAGVDPGAGIAAALRATLAARLDGLIDRDGELDYALRVLSGTAGTDRPEDHRTDSER